MQHTIDAGPGVMGLLAKVFAMMLAGNFITVLATSTAVAVVTYQVLNIFVNNELFTHKQNTMPEEDKRILGASFWVIIGTLLPIIITFLIGWNTPNIKTGQILQTIFIGAAIMVVLTLIFSANYCKVKGLKFAWTSTFPDAMADTIDLITKNTARWIANLLMWLCNTIVNIIHVPMVNNYTVVSVILNVMLSFILLEIIGINSGMAAANMIGSLIGGVAHAIIARKTVAKIKSQLNGG